MLSLAHLACFSCYGDGRCKLSNKFLSCTSLNIQYWSCYCGIGYVDDKKATTEILDSDGWLKTGDLCYINNEGYLFLVDRLKELIKCKGYQVFNLF